MSSFSPSGARGPEGDLVSTPGVHRTCSPCVQCQIPSSATTHNCGRGPSCGRSLDARYAVPPVPELDLQWGSQLCYPTEHTPCTPRSHAVSAHRPETRRPDAPKANPSVPSSKRQNSVKTAMSVACRGGFIDNSSMKTFSSGGGAQTFAGEGSLLSASALATSFPGRCTSV